MTLLFQILSALGVLAAYLKLKDSWNTKKPSVTIDIRDAGIVITASDLGSDGEYERRTLTKKLHIQIIAGNRTNHVNDLMIETKHGLRWQMVSKSANILKDEAYYLEPGFSPFELKPQESRDFLIQAISLHRANSFRIKIEYSGGKIRKSKAMNYPQIRDNVIGVVHD